MTRSVASPQLPIYSLAETSRNGAADFEVARVNGMTHRQKELFFVPHRKDFYLIGLVRSATARHWVDMIPYSPKPDTLYFSAPHQVFLKEDGVMDGVSICFTQEFLDLEGCNIFGQLPIIRNPQNAHELALSGSDIAFLDDITEKMLAESETPSAYRSSMLLSWLRILLLHLSRMYEAQYPAEASNSDREILRRFQSLVNVHYETHHEVAAYAAMVQLSTGHFSEVIKKQSGKSPIEHIHDRIILEAKRLLFHTDASMKEIAFRLGFDEASYFNRFFKRLTEVTPLSYRNDIREKYH